MSLLDERAFDVPSTIAAEQQGQEKTDEDDSQNTTADDRFRVFPDSLTDAFFELSEAPFEILGHAPAVLEQVPRGFLDPVADLTELPGARLFQSLAQIDDRPAEISQFGCQVVCRFHKTISPEQMIRRLDRRQQQRSLTLDVGCRVSARQDGLRQIAGRARMNISAVLARQSRRGWG